MKYEAIGDPLPSGDQICRSYQGLAVVNLCPGCWTFVRMASPSIACFRRDDTRATIHTCSPIIPDVSVFVATGSGFLPMIAKTFGEPILIRQSGDQNNNVWAWAAPFRLLRTVPDVLLSGAMRVGG